MYLERLEKGDKFVALFASKISKYFVTLAIFCFVASIISPNIYQPHLSFNSEFLTFTSLFCLALFFSAQGKRIELTQLPVMLMAFACVPALQWLMGLIYFSDDALFSSFFLIASATSFVLGHSLFKEYKERVLAYFFCTMVFIGAVNSFLTLYQLLDLGYLGAWVIEVKRSSGLRPYANLAQPNHLACIQAIGCIGAWYIYEKGLISGRVTGFLLFLLLIGLVLPQSRASLVCVILLFVVYFLFLRKVLKVKPLCFVLFTVVVPGLIFASIPVLLGLFEADIALRGSYASSSRISILGELLLALSSSPLFGFGWGQVNIAQASLINSPFEYTQPVNDAHNFILNILIWNGILLGGIFIMGLMLWLFKVVKNYTASSINSWAVISVMIILVHGMVGRVIGYAFALLPLFFLLGVINKQANFQCYRIMRKEFQAVFLLCFAVVLAGYFVSYRALESSFTNFRFRMIGYEVGNIVIPQSGVQRTLYESTYKNMEFALLSLDKNKVKAITDDELDEFRTVVYRYPSSFNLIQLSKILSDKGYCDERSHILGILYRIQRINNMPDDQNCPDS